MHGPRAGRGGAARNRPPVAGPTGIAGRARGEEAACRRMHLKPAPAADPPQRLPPRAVGRPEQRRASGLRAVVDVARLLFALHPHCRSRWTPTVSRYQFSLFHSEEQNATRIAPHCDKYHTRMKCHRLQHTAKHLTRNSPLPRQHYRTSNVGALEVLRPSHGLARGSVPICPWSLRGQDGK